MVLSISVMVRASIARSPAATPSANCSALGWLLAVWFNIPTAFHDLALRFLDLRLKGPVTPASGATLRVQCDAYEPRHAPKPPGSLTKAVSVKKGPVSPCQMACIGIRVPHAKRINDEAPIGFSGAEEHCRCRISLQPR
ncbi:protein of unknown function [Candidatus Filomicrobium marinum]|nr:protein of unknown function [Candidatus Filomicrobium marinum]